jgi:hypothetical protein
MKELGKNNLYCLEGDPIIIDYPSYEFVKDDDGNKVMDSECLYEISTKKNLEYRVKILNSVKANPKMIPVLKEMCKQNILFYVNTFCYTYRTDLSGKGKNPYVNFCSFPFQDDLLTWMVWSYKQRKPGIIEKSRDVGATWIFVFFKNWLTLFHPGVTTMSMSQNKEDVDNRTGKSIFEKFRINMRMHPEWLRGGWVEHNNATDKQMAIKIPETSSEILGDVAKGDAGRSGRGSVVFYDEFAHILEAPSIIEAGSALSGCKFYISTPKGDNNEFARMANTSGVNKKSIYWNLHPLRNKAWEKNKRDEPEITDEVFAQEFEISYNKSTIGRVYNAFESGLAGNSESWVHVQEDDYFDYDPNYPVYTAMDFGRDMTYIGFFQIKPVHHLWVSSSAKRCIIFFDEYAESNKTAYEIRKYINEKNYLYETHIGDMRTVIAKDSLGRGWGYYLTEDPLSVKTHYGLDVGPPIHVTGSIVSRGAFIDAMTNVLNVPGAFCFHKRCNISISAMNNWSYEVDKYARDHQGRPMLKFDSKPKHDHNSHPCTGVYHGVYHVINEVISSSYSNQSSNLDWSKCQQSLSFAI